MLYWREAETWAEETRVETEKQQNIAANANSLAENATTDTGKATLEEAKHSAEEAKVILLKTKKYPKEALAKFKLKAEQAKAILKKCKEAAKNSKYLDKNESELVNYQIFKTSNLKLNLEIYKDKLEWEYFQEEFDDQQLYYEHINSCQSLDNFKS